MHVACVVISIPSWDSFVWKVQEKKKKSEILRMPKVGSTVVEREIVKDYDNFRSWFLWCITEFAEPSIQEHKKYFNIQDNCTFYFSGVSQDFNFFFLTKTDISESRCEKWKISIQAFGEFHIRFVLRFIHVAQQCFRRDNVHNNWIALIVSVWMTIHVEMRGKCENPNGKYK